MTNGSSLWNSESASTLSSDNSTSQVTPSGLSQSEAGPSNFDAREQGVWIQGNRELLSLVCVLQGATDSQQGASSYDCINLLEKCTHCGCSFTPEAYRLHILPFF